MGGESMGGINRNEDRKRTYRRRRDDREMEADECPVCQDKLQDPIRLSECNHEFCRRCLCESISLRRHCPVCRVPVNGDYLTALPSQTRQSRVGIRRSRHSLIPSFTQSTIGSSDFDGIQSQMSQLSASQNQSGSPNPSPALSYAPFILPPVLTPPLGLSRPSFPIWRSTTAQTAYLLGLAHNRLYQNTTISPLDVYGDLPIFADENEEMQNLLVEQMQAEQRGPVLNSLRLFACPYCQQGGMDELALRDHCNIFHRHDPSRVVCPVCTSLPHGDENYYSRNFIAHLNLRHSYYSQDITDIHQSDAMNLQVAILDSLRTSQ